MEWTLVVFAFLTSFFAVSHGKAICISPQGCMDLNEFCKNPSNMSDLIVYITEGEHELNETCEVSNVKNWTMKAESEPVKVHCSPQVDSGLIFSNVSGLTITGIEFIECGMEWNAMQQQLLTPSSIIVSALLFVNGSDLALTDITLSDSKSAGIYIYNVAGNVSIDSCKVNNAISRINTMLSGNAIAYDRHEKTNLSITNMQVTNSGYNPRCYKTDADSNSSGLLLILGNPKLNVSISNSVFSHNKGCNGGNMKVLFYLPSPVSISNTIFRNGSAKEGGGLHISMVKFPLGQNMTVDGMMMNMCNLSFIDNRANNSGGGLSLHWNRALPFTGIYNVSLSDSVFTGNIIGHGFTEGGFALTFCTYPDTLKPRMFSKFRLTLDIWNSMFHGNNNPQSDNEYQLENSVIIAYEVPYLGLHGITVKNNNCTGILAVDSTLEFFDSAEISNNRAFSGAGLKLCSGSIIYFTPNSQLLITNNTAVQTGGGIYACPRFIVGIPSCFYQFSREITSNSSLVNTVDFTVEGNTALSGGDNLFGGSIDNCYFHNVKLGKLAYASALNVTGNTISNDSSGTIQNSSISSLPLQVCFSLTTQNGSSYCNKTIQTMFVHPGKKITLKVYVVGQSNGSTKGTVSASIINEGPISIIESQKDQTVGMSGGNVTYTIYSNQPKHEPSGVATMAFKANRIYQQHYPATIKLNLQKCPFGFIYPNNSSNSDLFSCQCILPQEAIPTCSVENSTLIRGDSWVGIFKMNNTPYLATSFHCPFDFCNTSVKSIHSSGGFLNQDEQCQYNRTGILCGYCPPGWSMLLGPSSECREECSNMWLLLILPFALAGIVLVAIIHFLNLTVTSGTICGLIFYANIMQDYSKTIFTEHPVPGLTRILLIFLSWLNLDLGIPTCFYSTMGAVGKTLLLFLFPVYLWIISAVIIFLSNRYLSFTRFVGENATKVLATLFLLSYSKMFRIVASILNLSIVKVYINNATTVSEYRWVLNGNIAYFDSENHFPLVIVAFLFLVIFSPFTLALLCLKQTYALSNYSRRLSWLNKLKPFFDSYTGPFKDNARFWTGLLLLVRVFMLAVHTQDYKDEYTPYYTIIIITLCLTAIMYFRGGVYQKKFLNTLEYFFILNITCIFLINIYKNGGSLPKSILTHILVSFSFLVFLGIIGYHVWLKFPGMISASRLTFWNRQRNGEMDALLSFDREENYYGSTKSNN